MRLPFLFWTVFFLAGALWLPVAASPPVVPRSALPQIEQQLRSGDPELQLRGLGQLMYIEGGATDFLPLLPRLLKLSDSDDAQVAHMSLSLIGQSGWLPEARRKHGPAMISAIGEAMRKEDSRLRLTAAHAMLAPLVDENVELALPVVLSAVTDEEESVRMFAAVTMGRLHNAKVVAALREALADPAIQVRRQAALALAKLAPTSEAAIPELVVALRDSSGEVSGSAAHALGQMGDAALEKLLALTDSHEPRVRHAALEALCSGHMTQSGLSDENAQRIVSVAQQMLNDRDPSVRTAAAIRVSVIGDLEARVAAIPLLIEGASGKESLEGWNCYLGLNRCIRSFVAGLMDAASAPVAFRGLQQFDEDYLRSYLQEYHQRFESMERGDIRPLLRMAAKNSVDQKHQRFAAQMLTWLPADEERTP